jgi:hypothetical protein
MFNSKHPAAESMKMFKIFLFPMRRLAPVQNFMMKTY